MQEVLMPMLWVAGAGAFLGLMLGLAAKFMNVPIDELEGKIRTVLPGANCGACGFAGCNEYAEHLASGSEERTNLCTPGGTGVAVAVSSLLGVQAAEVVATYAVVHCGGTCEHTHDKMKYSGAPTCAECATYFSGKGSCAHGCMGFGDCITTCNYGAIRLENGVPVVNQALCTGCTMCMVACPHHLIDMRPTSSTVQVLCSSHAKGGEVRGVCSAGCIGCKRCEKTCNYNAIHVTEHLAEIDPARCTNCKACVTVCPTHCIQIQA